MKNDKIILEELSDTELIKIVDELQGETFLPEDGMFYKIFADIVKKLYFYKSLITT